MTKSAFSRVSPLAIERVALEAIHRRRKVEEEATRFGAICLPCLLIDCWFVVMIDYHQIGDTSLYSMICIGSISYCVNIGVLVQLV